MNREHLEFRIMQACASICNEVGFLNEKTVDGKIGGTNRRKVEKYIHSISLSQTRTMGVSNNHFKISLGASCVILEIENLWSDFKSLVNPRLEDEKYQSYFEKQTPITYSISYDKNSAKAKFPDNIEDSGWLSFEISDDGISRLQEVFTYIIKELIVPKLEKQKTIAELDKNVNSKVGLDKLDTYIINKEGFIYRRIIIAKLNSNELFEDICNYHRQGFSEYVEISKRKGYEYFKNIPIVFEKVYERLQNLDIA